MKKFFIALSVLAALMLTVVPSQALIGMPDDTPGNSAVVPFICDISGTTGLNTLIAFTDVGLLDGIDFHYVIFTVKSATVYDDNVAGTAGEIIATDAFTELGKIPPLSLPDLEVDLDGDGVNDHYAGYISYISTRTTNSVIGQFYFVDLANGLAAAANIPMKEYKEFPALTALFQPNMAPATRYLELFSANAMQGAEDLQDGLAAPTDATSFGIYPRFFILGSGDANWLIFWKSTNADPGIVHINIYDNAENKVSINIPLDSELTILDLEPYLPLSIFPAASYPKEGWLDLEWATNSAALRNLEILGWVYQQAASNAGSLNWTVLFPMARDLP